MSGRLLFFAKRKNKPRRNTKHNTNKFNITFFEVCFAQNRKINQRTIKTTRGEKEMFTSDLNDVFKIQRIAVDDINEPSIAMRANIDKPQLTELIDSIAMHGLISPIILKQSGEKYEIVAGHRRYLAVKYLHWSTIPAIITSDENKKLFMIRYEENAKRQDVSIIDEALYLAEIQEELHITQTELAQMIGRSNSYVSERLEVNNYPPEIVAALKDGDINFSVAREFAKITDEHVRRNFLKYAIISGINPETARKWRKQWQEDKEEPYLSPDQEEQDGTRTQANDAVFVMPCFMCQTEHPIRELKPHYLCPDCAEQVRS